MKENKRLFQVFETYDVIHFMCTVTKTADLREGVCYGERESASVHAFTRESSREKDTNRHTRTKREREIDEARRGRGTADF